MTVTPEAPTGMHFVALDVETANPFRGSICQVGLALVRDGRIAATWGVLVRPPRPHDWFDPDHVAVHGITERHLRDAPSFEDAWPGIAARLGGRATVAHNAAFDTGCLRDATAFCRIDWPSLDVACSLVVARQLLDLPSYGLDVVASATGVPLARHHDAVHDAVACAQITVAMAERVGAGSLGDLLDVAGVAWGAVRAREYAPCRTTIPAPTGVDAPATLF